MFTEHFLHARPRLSGFFIGLFLILFGSYLLYYLLVSTVQQGECYISHLLLFGLPSHLGHHRSTE